MTLRRKMDPAYITSLVGDVSYIQPEGSTVTFCIMELTNGCTITGQSNVIDPANYDAELGKQAAYSNTLNKIWELEGYALKRDLNKPKQ